MSVRYLNISQLSEATGLDRATVRKKLIDLKPVSVEAKATIYDAREALRILFDFNKKKIDDQLLAEQLRYEQARADKMQIEVEERRGQLEPVSEVAKKVGAEYANVRARLLSIPSRCAKDLSIEHDPSLVKQRLDQEIHEALAELTADETYQEKSNVEQSDANIEASPSEDAQAAADPGSTGVG